MSESGTETDGEDYGEDGVAQKDGFFEDTSHGAVKGNLLVKYIKSGTNGFVGIFVLFLFLATQSCVSLYDYFVPIL